MLRLLSRSLCLLLIAFTSGTLFAEEPVAAPQAPADAVKHPVGLLEEYVGSYKFIEQPLTMVVTLDGEQLFAQPDGQPKAELYGTKELDQFKLVIVAAELKFLRNEKGEVEGFLYKQNGGEFHANRLPATEQK